MTHFILQFLLQTSFLPINVNVSTDTRTCIRGKWQLYYQNWHLYLQHLGFRCANSVSRLVVANLTDAFFATCPIRGKGIYLERDRQCGASCPNPQKNLSCSHNLLIKLYAPHRINKSLATHRMNAGEEFTVGQDSLICDLIYIV